MAEATVADVAVALDRRDGHTGVVERFLAGVDAWVCPVSASPAVTHHAPGEPVPVDGATVPYLMGGLGHCVPFNVTGHPVVTLPIGRSADGLPIGCQIVGRRWDEMRLLAVAERIEALVGAQAPPSGQSVP